jgi:alpha-L-rhamnosidase-like protein
MWAYCFAAGRPGRERGDPLTGGVDVPRGRVFRCELELANLGADLVARGDNVNTGAIGTQLLLPVLTEHGLGDLAYKVATQSDYPSWGYWVAQGATSSWET